MNKEVEDMGLVLLVVPLLSWAENSVFDVAGFLRLDSLLEVGHAAVVYKRLLVSSYCYPEMRAVADEFRRQYLKKILPDVLMGQSNLVVVGTHPADADLLDFKSVDLLMPSEPLLADLSCAKYGEPGMMAVEYSSISSLLCESVDSYVAVSDWRDMNQILSMRYRMRAVQFKKPTENYVRAMLREAALDADLDDVWLEDPSHMVVPVLTPEAEYQFDYLVAIRPDWRDAVLRVMLKSPAVRTFIMMPWYVVDKPGLETLCYNRRQDGSLEVSTRGESLMRFVKEKLNGVLNPEELVGTMVGALLCDPVVTDQAVRALNGRVVLPINDSTARDRQSMDFMLNYEEHISIRTCRVPRDFMWMYALCPDVLAFDWSGERDAAGMPISVAEDDLWHHTTPLAMRLGVLDSTYPGHRSDIVAFMRRVYTMGPGGRTLAVTLTALLERIELGETITEEYYTFLAMLPGLQYLREAGSREKLPALKQLQFYPSLDVVHKFFGTKKYDRRFLQFELMAKRREIFDSGPVSIADMVVGSTEEYSEHAYDSGYCYLLMFHPSVRETMKTVLGRYPMFSKVITADPRDSIKRYRHLYVSKSEIRVSGKLMQVLHVASKPTEHSMSLEKFRKKFGKLKGDKRLIRIGDSGGTAGGTVTPGYVSDAPADSAELIRAIMIGSLIVNIVLIAVMLLYFLWKKCCGMTGGRKTNNRGCCC